jgi:tRNA G46 methylase TrmB
LLTPAFFERLHVQLKAGGKLELATDNFDYFIAFRRALVEAGDSLWSGATERRNERIMDPGVQTHFEAKYTRAGRDLYYMELVK